VADWSYGRRFSKKKLNRLHYASPIRVSCMWVMDIWKKKMNNRERELPRIPITNEKQWQYLNENGKVYVVKRKGVVRLQGEHPIENQFLAIFNHEQKNVVVKYVKEMELHVLDTTCAVSNDENLGTQRWRKTTIVKPKDREELKPYVKDSGFADVSDWLKALTEEFLSFFPNYPRHMTFGIFELTLVMNVMTEYWQ
jgi:hypothetical protein